MISNFFDRHSSDTNMLNSIKTFNMLTAKVPPLHGVTYSKIILSAY